MDRIINGNHRKIGPNISNGSAEMLSIIKQLSDNSTLPLRSNWRNIIPSLQTAKERLASTDRYINLNRSNWIALEHLPKVHWLNGAALVGSCAKWNYSRWYSAGPTKN
jgi:hypothetical protein